VAAVREATTQRLGDTLAARPNPAQARQLERTFMTVGSRSWSGCATGSTATSGKGMAAALERVAEVAALGFGAATSSVQAPPGHVAGHRRDERP